MNNPKLRKIEQHKILDAYAAYLLEELQEKGVVFSIVGENALHVHGEMDLVEREYCRRFKRQIIDALSPKCSRCESPMKLIYNGELWLCPLGCESRGV